MRDSIEVQLSVKKREKRSQDFARSIFTILDSLILAAAEILRDFAIYTGTAVSKLIPQLLGDN